MVNYAGIGSQPVGPGPDATSCGTSLAKNIANVGGQSNDFYKQLNSAMSGKIEDNLTALAGDSATLKSLTDQTARLIDSRGETIDRIRRASAYNDWLNSTQKLNTARAEVIYQARQNLSSTNFQQQVQNPDISANLTEIYNNVTGYLSDISNNYFIINNIYNDASENFQIITNLLEMKEKTLFDIIGNIQLYEKKYDIDLRKNMYEFERNTLYNNIFNILKILYYALFVVYIIFGNFMKLQLYRNPYFYFVAILYLVLPFALKYIFAAIIYLYEKILKFLGMNKEIYTYSDIVRASNLENIYTGPVPSVLDSNDIEDAYALFVQNPINSSRLFM